MIIDGQLKVQNVPIAQLCVKLWQLRFMPLMMDRLRLLAGRASAVQDEAADEG